MRRAAPSEALIDGEDGLELGRCVGSGSAGESVHVVLVFVSGRDARSLTATCSILSYDITSHPTASYYFFTFSSLWARMGRNGRRFRM